MEEERLDEKILSFKEYEAAKIISTLVGSKKEILNVGSFWGRDYFYLKKKGKNVTNIDIVDNGLPCTIIADITDENFSLKKKFDVVLIAEVLEHLFKDFKALQNAREVLREDDYLIITVSFFNDFADYHVRVYTPKTIKRLLESEGFKIEKIIYRGNLISFSKIINAISKFIGLFSYKLRIKFLDLLVDLDIFLGRSELPARFSRFFGAYIMAKKHNKKTSKK